MDTLISTLEEKTESLTSVFQPFLNVIDPDKPGNLEDARALVATLSSVFSQDTFATLHNEFKLFFRHFDDLKQQQGEEGPSADVEPSSQITKAAEIALSQLKSTAYSK